MQIATVIMGAAIGLMGFMGSWIIRRMQKQMDESTAKVTEIQVNYLDRFADLKSEVNRGHGEIKDAIADLREHLASNYVSKADCPQLHKQ
jgi:hypothetical protein